MYNFEQMLLSQISNVKTEPEIIELAEKLRDSGLFDYLSSEMYQNALDNAIDTLNISFGESYSVESQDKHDPWFESFYKELGITRWDRYVDYLQSQKRFAPAVINGMRENLFKITDLLGNPNGENFKRKGLVVGDVQSGKTANYVGLMNLATDANYKLIIVLTGTTNKLREQTQIRIEEGLGISSSSRKDKGVTSIKNATYKDFMPPMYLTSKTDDFNKNSVKNAISLEQTTVPIVIVTKKNTNALKSIYSWIDEYSRIQNHDHIDSSVLMIDDEADFASVDTSKDEEQPTAINSSIRKILELFTKSSYIGFTATPFANIFIDPENDSQMLGQDLFPSDYIYVLGESKEYLGVQQIFSENAAHGKMLVPLKEEYIEETYLPLKHKKDSSFERLSPSMMDAINVFFIANVIRDLRGDENSHRSMLFNISRYSDMHTNIKDIVQEYILSLQKDIRLNGKLPIEEAMKKESIVSMSKSYEKHYLNLKEGYTFEAVLRNMNDSVHRIKVAIINKDNKGVDYLAGNEEKRVIVIGGFSLSRGLTLEGLMVSYYRRNSVTYDSLLQMGRWFGYRPNYEDLVRIYMSDDVISDFEFIAMATKELKEDLELNSNRGLTPRQFGIKVRSGQIGLIITARNKMGTGSKMTASVDFNKDIVETLAISIEEKEANQKNINVITELIENNRDQLSESIHPNRKNVLPGLINIDKVHVIQFLREFIPFRGSKFDSSLIIKWLNSNESPILSKWDFAFVSGTGQNTFDFGNNVKGNTSVRTMIKAKGIQGIYKSKNSRLGSPTDGAFGLSKVQYDNVKSYNRNKGTIPQKNYFDESLNRKPIIIIYAIEPYDSGTKNVLTDQVIPMISIGIPDLGKGRSHRVDYVVNKLYQEVKEIEVEN
ncbi:hypothetical protein FEZ48_08115 [Marinilactibacillus psychrotolerans]|uniref:Endonuclease Z1 domain-containing protein n=1 Tax=Marinilactibacillus psychrotolerans TaxID=191770 RepID=A0A5R9C2I6_9LACT|nr:Z1 domain-containing protein [Marinilactibacillus psychrotolerans]TLQ06958.1 hypothetical protein FEZ48_08115 [Marinilactibacillus psychrotolerans]